MKDDQRQGPFRDAHQDIESSQIVADSPQARSPAYRLAFADPDFLCRDELRPVRLQLELLKPQLEMDERGIESTVVMFGGARIPAPGQAARSAALQDMSRYYEEAQKFARLVTERSVATGCTHDVVVTGGGPGVMEAGNRGASEAGGCSIGLNIVLPHEQVPNAYITPELCFNFHYFGIRKMHFLIRAKAVAVFPGGFGTLDELFESLTLIQTGRMEQVPVILFGESFWREVVNWDALAEAGTIARDDLDLFRFVETAEEAMAVIDGWRLTGKRGEIPGR
ncbi:TIGR00730 family Rossman fold protein [Roseobacter sp. HKCCD9010]|uniref:LOG family protein n=1 Tax=Rhodobacterales TaxID=204455 RepID=UPI001490A500|nr:MULTISPECIES: TIGR00730 family Rossman fold protein [Rhodobacterales]MBF9051020.1 TIGR00730 family Rossman fold protein [Rhodobacterales bacterium HKCCD4356]NNV12789.1 TIGR00730 family Rossman fold protein [Roseobacter sp. HKCCD7357]NNV16734.1 TIGR00730 family Rossman fold protein [Roseobacter sp. HKCCD8768]NNV26634.1 TIGR00730 family Rossman fold protein [Roseobacter sp. HKCCD8192]NNV30454.1 TIGR00730 family Rossman fold protein [Roseobacter sp. HKCCD9061]